MTPALEPGHRQIGPFWNPLAARTARSGARSPPEPPVLEPRRRQNRPFWNPAAARTARSGTWPPPYIMRETLWKRLGGEVSRGGTAHSSGLQPLQGAFILAKNPRPGIVSAHNLPVPMPGAASVCLGRPVRQALLKPVPPKRSLP